jgi:23S rRNA (guanosine2251-2'-O)-methyltransferase
MAEKARAQSGGMPVLVALDGVMDPRNLGAIVRSVAAFGGAGVIVPQRRSAGVNATSWKTSAGAIARTPVAMAPNLTQTLKALKERGYFVVGLDGDATDLVPGADIAATPLVIVVGSEGKGLSRLVTETCDLVLGIPISAKTESLNAGIAASVVLYEVARARFMAKKS